MERFHIEDVHSTPSAMVDSPMNHVARRTSPENHRKRGASTTELPRELDLQQHVRQLLRFGSDPAFASKMVLPDRSVEDSRKGRFLNGGDEGLQSPSLAQEFRLPMQKQSGAKRTCCGSELMRQQLRRGLTSTF
jgi:hypothetical protein